MFFIVNFGGDLHLAVNELGLTLCRFHLDSIAGDISIQLLAVLSIAIYRRDPSLSSIPSE